jgi:hypothetical protein
MQYTMRSVRVVEEGCASTARALRNAFRARGVARKRARKIVGFEGLKGCENFDALVQLYTEL